ncbi:sulfatase [Cyclobacterium amurskyense]|uniref:sulfatase n=1 Tax=Cyclobacterium amurskyense TaxID=320787 RepID=UPI0030D89D5B|tara:strand:- start:10852 stop:12270 length:1419 start_codon:yes stop_codon:yes gene_type:complete
MNRKPYKPMLIKYIVNLLIAFLVSGAGLIAQGQSRPNILLLLADDLGYRDLSCYGSTQVITPNLDKLASKGMRFTDFYAGSAVCSPSRAALMTGRSSVRAGIYSWIHTSHKMHLAKTEFTTAELLKQAGYATAHIGKWHLGYDLEEGAGPGPNPGDQGFDHWIATGNNAIPSHHNPDNFVRNGLALGEVKGYSSHLLADEAIDWLERRPKDQPFFINMWFHEPHQKVAAPDVYLEKHQDTDLPAYYGSIENMDAAIGRVLMELEKQGLIEQTLIVFMSDNGSYRGRSGSNGELANGKTTLWEGGIRVPGIFSWPGVIAEGTIENRPAGVVDIFPTIKEIIGGEIDPKITIDGSSLLPIFEQKSFERQKPLYWFYPPSRPIAVIREGPWNLIADPELDIPRGNMFQEAYIGMIKETKLQNFRLYNLRNDPKQTKDVSAENPEVFEKMIKEMIKLNQEIVEEAMDWRDFSWTNN